MSIDTKSPEMPVVAPKRADDGSPVVFTQINGSASGDPVIRNPAPNAGAVAAPSGAYREYKVSL